MCSFVVGFGDSPETLLAGGVPDLEFDIIGVDHEGSK